MKKYILLPILLISLFISAQEDRVAPVWDVTRPNSKTTAEMNSMTRMVEGSEVYNGTTKTIWRYNGTIWVDTETGGNAQNYTASPDLSLTNNQFGLSAGTLARIAANDAKVSYTGVTGNEAVFDGWDKDASDDDNFDGTWASLTGIPADILDGDDIGGGSGNHIDSTSPISDFDFSLGTTAQLDAETPTGATIEIATDGATGTDGFVTDIAVTGTGTKTITLQRNGLPNIETTFTDDQGGTAGVADGNDYLTNVTETNGLLNFNVQNQTNPTFNLLNYITNIPNGTINGTKIVSNSIGRNQIGVNAIGESELGSGIITPNNLNSINGVGSPGNVLTQSGTQFGWIDPATLGSSISSGNGTSGITITGSGGGSMTISSHNYDWYAVGDMVFFKISISNITGTITSDLQINIGATNLPAPSLDYGPYVWSMRGSIVPTPYTESAAGATSSSIITIYSRNADTNATLSSIFNVTANNDNVLITGTYIKN